MASAHVRSRAVAELTAAGTLGHAELLGHGVQQVLRRERTVAGTTAGRRAVPWWRPAAAVAQRLAQEALVVWPVALVAGALLRARAHTVGALAGARGDAVAAQVQDSAGSAYAQVWCCAVASPAAAFAVRFTVVVPGQLEALAAERHRLLRDAGRVSYSRCR